MTKTNIHSIVLASGNQGKIREIKQILNKALPGIEVKGLKDFPSIGDIPETGKTFQENALIKARTVMKETGLISIADDSGLVVPALGGDPGVYSARYAGENATDQDNNDKLLQAMANLDGDQRQASFVCVMAAVMPDGREMTVQGEWKGLIALTEKGDNGFGYDPLFYDPELGLHSAQMKPELKNSRSHRGKALDKLASKWRDFVQS
ncbi:XTP/dITP diphosphatase [Desulfonatronovibrio magnus]|uniref:XTP/dITP diphosphatase n=1 Tax=Desulfonatronovibrio magnus TaxID=698827 RepID=UPI0005EAF0D0|nr:XTP/dITP diphosphatase [Desulfonatronovibrio magnus]